jgi:hypothetical protein
MSQQHQQPTPAGTAQQQPVEPNLFELSNQEIHVTYSSTSFTGQAQLSYHSPTGILTFQGQDIRIEQSELGILVSVTIVKTIDTGSTSLTLLLPHVNLAGSTQQPIHTVAIITRHLFGVLPRTGAQELYKVEHLSGMARLVEF